MFAYYQGIFCMHFFIARTALLLPLIYQSWTLAAVGGMAGTQSEKGPLLRFDPPTKTFYLTVLNPTSKTMFNDLNCYSTFPFFSQNSS